MYIQNLHPLILLMDHPQGEIYWQTLEYEPLKLEIVKNGLNLIEAPESVIFDEKSQVKTDRTCRKVQRYFLCHATFLWPKSYATWDINLCNQWDTLPISRCRSWSNPWCHEFFWLALPWCDVDASPDQLGGYCPSWNPRLIETFPETFHFGLALNFTVPCIVCLVIRNDCHLRPVKNWHLNLTLKEKKHLHQSSIFGFYNIFFWEKVFMNFHSQSFIGGSMVAPFLAVSCGSPVPGGVGNLWREAVSTPNGRGTKRLKHKQSAR